MKAIVALDKNRAIGFQGNLPWPRHKQDLQWFKEFTLNQSMLIGYNTYQTLPLLKNRIIYVYNRDENFTSINCNVNTQYNFVCNIDQIPNNVIVAGGSKTYFKFDPYISEYYTTYINGSFTGDVFMFDFEKNFLNFEKIKHFDDGSIVVRFYNKKTEVLQTQTIN